MWVLLGWVMAVTGKREGKKGQVTKLSIML